MFFSLCPDKRIEIIDGVQRTSTFEQFMSNDLVLKDLEKLTELEGFTFKDLPQMYKAIFENTNVRIVLLQPDTTLEVRKEIFNRINTAGRRAKAIEIRRGIHHGEFITFLERCSNHQLFKKLCPISEILQKRYEHLELILRFFAYTNSYREFKHNVDKFLDKYIDDNEKKFDLDSMEKEFVNMLTFVDKYFKNGFAKTATAKSTPRVRFEAISVGVALALREKPDLKIPPIDWLESDDFEFHTTTHASNSPKRLAGRVEFVKNKLLEASYDESNE